MSRRATSRLPCWRFTITACPFRKQSPTSLASSKDMGVTTDGFEAAEGTGRTKLVRGWLPVDSSSGDSVGGMGRTDPTSAPIGYCSSGT